MLPFLALHALAAQRGDGLRPELLAVFERHARSEAGLAAVIEPVETDPPYQVVDLVPEPTPPKLHVHAAEKTSTAKC